MTSVYDQDNVFAKILRDELPSIKIYEDEHSLAFMDVMPQRDGHVLVIPKEPATTIYDLSEQAALACMKTVQKVGTAVQKAMAVNGSSVFQFNGKEGGQTVPHFHFHILPGSLSGLRQHAADFADQQHLAEIAEKIISCLD